MSVFCLPPPHGCVQEGSLECYLVDCGVPADDVDRVVTQVGTNQRPVVPAPPAALPVRGNESSLMPGCCHGLPACPPTGHDPRQRSI
jgi:hypothetical protein